MHVKHVNPIAFGIGIPIGTYSIHSTIRAAVNAVYQVAVDWRNWTQIADPLWAPSGWERHTASHRRKLASVT